MQEQGHGLNKFNIVEEGIIIRDDITVIMVAPKWLKTKCQPISISDVLKFLTGVLKNPITYNQNFDIGGPKVLSYKQMLIEFAEERKLWRKIFVVPVLTPKLSSYWLYFITSTKYSLIIFHSFKPSKHRCVFMTSLHMSKCSLVLRSGFIQCTLHLGF